MIVLSLGSILKVIVKGPTAFEKRVGGTGQNEKTTIKSGTTNKLGIIVYIQ